MTVWVVRTESYYTETTLIGVYRSLAMACYKAYNSLIENNKPKGPITFQEWNSAHTIFTAICIDEFLKEEITLIIEKTELI